MENTELDPITQQPTYPNRGGIKPNLTSNLNSTRKSKFAEFMPTSVDMNRMVPMGQYYPKESSQYDAGIAIDILERGDINEWRSEQQGVLPSMGNSIVKFAAKTGINVIGGTAGTIYGLGAAAADGKLSSMWDNQVINELDSWSKGLDAAMPVYKSADYQNANFLEKFLNPVMMFDELSDVASFTAGAVLTELLTAGLASGLVAARATGVIGKVLKASQVAGAVERTAVKALGYDALKFGRRVLTGANYEASVEANQAKREYKQLALQDYMQANNIQDPEAVPTEVIDKIDIEGNSVGNTVWGQNLAILHASHMLQFPSTFGNTFNTARKFLPKGVVAAGDAAGLGSKAVKGIKFSADDVADAAYKTATRGEKIASNAYTFSKNALTEGLWEEGMQTTVSEAAKNYWQKKYDINNLNEAVSYADSFGEGLAKSYGTKEGWNSIGMGMLIGMVGSPGKGLLPGQIGIDKQTGKRADMWQGGALGEFKERDKKRAHLDRLVEDYNTHATNAMVTPAIVAGIENLAVEQSNTSEENSKIENDDKFGTLNVRDDKFTMFVDTRNKTGKFSTVEDTFDSMERMTPEEFKQNFYDQTNDKVIDRGKQQEIIKGLRNKANKIRETRGTINAIIQTDPFSNYDKTTETYKDQLVYEMSKVDMTDARSEEIIKLLGEAMGNHLAGQKIKDWHKLAIDTNMSVDKVTTLKNHAKGMNLQIKKLEKSEPELTDKINKNIEEEKVLSTKLQDSSKKRDDIVRKIQKASDKLGLLKVTTLETNVLDAKTKEVQQEIDSLNKEIEVLDADTANTQAKLDKNKEAHTKYSEQLAKDKEDTVQAQKEYDDFVKDNLAELQKKAKDKSPDIPQFKYDNYEEYAKAIGDLLFESEDIQKTLQDVYGRDPLKAEEIQPLVTDLGKLTRMRYDLIDMYNLHRSAEGRAVLMASIESRDASFKERIAKQINLTKDITDKFKLGNTFKIVVNEDGEQVEYLAKVMKIKGEKELGILLMNPKTLEVYQGGAFKLDSFKNLIKQGYIESIEDFTEEEKVTNKEMAAVQALSSVNYETGVYSLTGTKVEVNGENYLRVDTVYPDGNPDIRYYELDDNGRVNPHYETSFEEDAVINEITQKSKHEFNGNLYNYTADSGNESTLVQVYESPFLSKGEYHDKTTYPTTLTVNLGGGKTLKLTKKNNSAEIHDLIDQLDEAEKSPIRLYGKPIVRYNGKNVTISYTINKAVKKIFNYSRRRKSNKNWKYKKSKPIWINPAEHKMPAFRLIPLDKSVEDLLASGEQLTSDLFHAISPKNTDNSTVSNFAEARDKTEVVQDNFTDIKGNVYTIVKFKDNLYAVPATKSYYQINPETNIISRRPITITPSKLKSIGEDLEAELSKETQEDTWGVDDKIDLVLGKLIPDLFYTAGVDVEYVKVIKENGKYFLKNKYNDDGTLAKSTIPSQRRWFDFITNKVISGEDFTKKYKLRVVINNGQLDETFDPEDSSEAIKTDFDMLTQYDKADVRVVLVDAETNEPVRVDGKLIFTSIHESSYPGVEQSDIEKKKADLNTFRNAVITQIHKNKKDVYITIDSLTEGSVATEKPEITEVGETGNTYNARQRNPIEGRLIPEGGSFESIEWGIVKKTGTDVMIPVAIDGVELPTQPSENGMVFTAIKGRNNKPLKVKLLTRQINKDEAATVVELLKLHSKGEFSINGNPILPTKEGINNIAEKALISRIIRWGSIKGNNTTSIYFDRKGVLHYGNNKITITELNDKDDKSGSVAALKAWLQSSKIAHVAEKFKGDTNFLSYKFNETTGKFEQEEWGSYNEYLFSDKNGRTPILTTDVIKKVGDGSNQIVQVNLKFNTGEYSTKSDYNKVITPTKKVTKKEEPGEQELDKDDPEYKAMDALLANLPKGGLSEGVALFGAPKQTVKEAFTVETPTEGATNLPLSAFGIQAPSPTTTTNDSTRAIDSDDFRLIATNLQFIQENEKEVREWFSRNFPNIPIEFGLFEELTKAKAWGRFKSSVGVLVSNKAQKGTTYHEAFHVVSTLGLSDKERKALYASVRKELKDKSLSYKTIEEFLADDFMNWKISGKSEIFATTEVKRSTFEKILDYITKLWNNLFNNNINGLELYSKIDNGGFSNLTINTKVENKNLNRLQGLTVNESEDLLQGLSYETVVEILKNYGGDLTKITEGLNTIIQGVLTKIVNDPNVTQPIKDYIKNPSNKQDFASGVKQYFEYIGLELGVKVNNEEEDEISDSQDEENRGKDLVSNAFSEAVMFSSLKQMSSTIKILIATLPTKVTKKDEQGNNKVELKLNSSGLVQTAPFGKTYISILEKLAGTPDIDGLRGMKAKLEELALIHPEISSLLARMNALKGKLGLKAWMDFRQAFSINKYNFSLLLIGKEATKLTDANKAKSEDRVKEEWNSGYKTSKALKNIKDRKKSELITFLESKHRAYVNPNGTRESINEALRESFEYMGIEIHPSLYFDPSNTTIMKLVISNYLEGIKKTDIFDLTKQFQEGRYADLAKLQAEMNQLFLEPTHLNPKGKSVYEYSLNTYITTTLNDIKMCAELPLTAQDDEGNSYNPRLTEFNKRLPHLVPLRGYSSWIHKVMTELERPVVSLDLGITFLEGIKEEKVGSIGKVTAELSETSMANLHLHSFFNKRGTNYYPIMPLRRPSDKSLEPGITGFEFVKGLDTFVNNMMKYLKFELDSNNNDLTKLYAFKAILGNDTLKQMGVYKGVGDMTRLPATADMIKRDILKFLTKKTKENIKYFENIGILRGNNNSISPELLRDYKGDTDSIIQDFTLNYTLSVFEQMMLFHGNFNQYEGFFKRTSGYVGTGKTFSNDAIVNDFIREDIITFLNDMKVKGVNISNRIDLALKLTPEQRKQFPEFVKVTGKSTIHSTNIVTLKEVSPKSKYVQKDLVGALENTYQEMLTQAIKDSMKMGARALTESQLTSWMSAYDKMDIADGLGMITLEEYRNFLLKSGGWDLLGNQEKVYQKVIRGERLSIKEVAYFPMIKPQGFGVKAFKNVLDGDGNLVVKENDNIAYEAVFAKLALIPIIPTAVDGLEMGNLLTSLQQSGATIAVMESVLKVGGEMPVDFKGNTQMIMPSINMDMKYWKIQVDMHSDIEDNDPDGTQQRKLLWLDLFVNGKALDPIFQTNFDEYSDIYQKLIDGEKVKFLKELSLELINGKYQVQDDSKFLAALRKEVSSRRLPSNVLNALTTGEDGKMLFPIDALPIASKIENILLARINNNLIKLKRPGTAYIQTSNLYWKSTGILTKSHQERVKQYAQELEFLRMKDGRIIGAEIMLPASWLGGLVKEGDDINKLVAEGKLDARLLNVMGYRIPTQGQNSMLPLVIKGFLPAEMGDTVILPYEIVAQSGSDFDIDKMHIFRPNYYKKDGKLIYIDATSRLDAIANNYRLDEENDDDVDYEAQLLAEESARLRVDKALMQNRLLEIQLETLTHPANIRNLLVSNGAEFLKEEADWLRYLREEVVTMVIQPEELEKEGNKAFIAWRVARNKRIKEQGINPETLISFKDEVKTGISFRAGKAGVAIVANQITAHSLFQQAGTKLSGFIKVKKNGVYGDAIPVVLNFEHKKEGDKPSLAQIYDVKGNLISEVNSEHLSGNVDITKDPFIFTLNTNGLTANVKYMMLNLGADRQWVNRFINQPIIEEYIKQRNINESVELESTKDNKELIMGNWESTSDHANNNKILISLYKKYSKTGLGKVNAGNILEALHKIHISYGKTPYSEKQLNRFIVDAVTNEEDKGAQLQILADFVAYQEYGRAFNNGIQVVKPDTNRIKNMDEAGKVLDDYQNVLEVGFFDNIDTLLNQGILKGFNSVHAAFMKKAYKSLFVTEIDNIQQQIYRVIKDDVTLQGFPITSVELDLVKQTLLTYLFQVSVNRYVSKLSGNTNSSAIVSPTSRERIIQLMTGDKSIPKQLAIFMKNPSVTNIAITDLLYPEISEESNGIDYVKTVNKNIDAVTADNFAEAMEEFYNSNPVEYNLLLEIAAAEFGSSNTAMSFMKYFDSTRIGEILSPIMKTLMNDGNMSSAFRNVDELIDSIYMINRNNEKLVPKIKMSKRVYHPTGKNGFNNSDVLIIDAEDSNYGRKFVKKWHNTIDKMDKTVFNPVVFKLHSINKDGEAVYIKVNIKGGYNLKEFNSTGLSADVKNHIEENRISLKDKAVIEEWIKKNIDTKAEFERVQKVLNQPFPSLDDFLPTTGKTVGTYRESGTYLTPKVDKVGQLSLFDTNAIEGNPQYKNKPEFNKLPANSSERTGFYTGVGSRNTPEKVLVEMRKLAKELEDKGYTLRTGDAKKADEAFRTSVVDKNKKEVYTAKDANDTTRKIAKEIHPNPSSLSEDILNLQARNTNQVFGKNLDIPSDFLIAWTPNGETKAEDRVYFGYKNPKNTGGTGQAIALASMKGIPVINLANPNWRVELTKIYQEKNCKQL